MDPLRIMLSTKQTTEQTNSIYWLQIYSVLYVCVPQTKHLIEDTCESRGRCTRDGNISVYINLRQKATIHNRNNYKKVIRASQRERS